MYCIKILDQLKKPYVCRIYVFHSLEYLPLSSVQAKAHSDQNMLFFALSPGAVHEILFHKILWIFPNLKQKKEDD